MKILVAAICEHSWIEDGCLTVCRAFDTVSAVSFPYSVPRLSVALRLLFRRTETGEHRVNVSLSDADGKKLMNTDLSVTMRLTEGGVPESAFSFALNGQNVVFSQPGDFVVDIVIDGKVEASVPLYVKKKQPPV
ncbi:MAG: hypothetical protein WC695_01800 [Candidatus Omnitrophota bacterium]